MAYYSDKILIDLLSNAQASMVTEEYLTQVSGAIINQIQETTVLPCGDAYCTYNKSVTITSGIFPSALMILPKDSEIFQAEVLITSTAVGGSGGSGGVAQDPTQMGNANNVWVDTYWSLSSGKALTAVSIGSSGPNTFKIKVGKLISGKTYNIIDLQTVTHSGGGVQTFALDTPYMVPDGTHRIILHWGPANHNTFKSTGGTAFVNYSSGDLSGNNIALSNDWDWTDRRLQVQAIYGVGYSIGTVDAHSVVMGFAGNRPPDTLVTSTNCAGPYTTNTQLYLYENSIVPDTGGSFDITLYYRNVSSTFSGTGNIITTTSGKQIVIDGSQLASLDWVNANFISNPEMTTISGDIVDQIPDVSAYATISDLTSVSGALEQSIAELATTVPTFSGTGVVTVVDGQATVVPGDCYSPDCTCISYVSVSGLAFSKICEIGPGIKVTSTTAEVLEPCYGGQSDTTEGHLDGSFAMTAGGNTLVSQDWDLDNGSIINKVALRFNNTTSFTLKVAHFTTATGMAATLTDIYSDTHTGTGQPTTYTLSVPYAVPSSGIYRLALYYSSYQTYAKSTTVGKNLLRVEGNVTGSQNLSVLYTDTSLDIQAIYGPRYSIGYGWDQEALMPLFVAGSGIVNTSDLTLGPVASTTALYLYSDAQTRDTAGIIKTTVHYHNPDHVTTYSGIGMVVTQSGTQVTLDASDFVTNPQLTTVSANIISQIPSLTGYATTSWVDTNFVDTNEITAYVTQVSLDTNFFDKTDITTISGDIIAQMEAGGVTLEQLTTTSGDIVAQITGGGLPAGEEGALLVHDGVDWISTVSGVFTAEQGFFSNADSEVASTTRIGAGAITLSGIDGYAFNEHVVDHHIMGSNYLAPAEQALTDVYPGSIDVYTWPLDGPSVGIYVDGVHFWPDESYSTELWISPSGIWFPDGTFQNTAGGATTSGGGIGDVTIEQLLTTSGNIIEQIPKSVIGTAGENISAYDLVYADPTGTFKIADYSDFDKADAVGLALNGASFEAEVEIQLLGRVLNTSWNLEQHKNIYLGSAGAITQTEPTQYFVKPMGFALSPDEIWLFPSSGWEVETTISGLTTVVSGTNGAGDWTMTFVDGILTAYTTV